LPQPLAIGQTVPLPEAVAHHVQVLRLAPGDLITLFNGEGGEYTASLSEIARAAPAPRSRPTRRARSSCRLP
jgi:16S rRNA (uracil1498-N3)-methyltransferase